MKFNIKLDSDAIESAIRQSILADPMFRECRADQVKTDINIIRKRGQGVSAEVSINTEGFIKVED